MLGDFPETSDAPELALGEQQAAGDPLQFHVAARSRILTVYYENYPENEVKRTVPGEMIFSPGDTHQITNPNTKEMVTTHRRAGPIRWDDPRKKLRSNRPAGSKRMYTFHGREAKKEIPVYTSAAVVDRIAEEARWGSSAYEGPL